MSTPEKINDNLSIYQNEGSLAFGTDAYLLSAYIKKQPKSLAAEFGAGSGVISLLLAARGKLRNITAFEVQEKIAAIAAKNVEANGFDPSRHTSLCCDAIDYLKQSPEGKYDLMIVDPPAFAKHRGSLKNALRAYQRLNAAAISKVAPGGFVFTYSCSQVVDKEAFALAVFSAAAQCGRSVRILDRLNQPCDHSVNIYHPEGEYLKGLLLYVE